MYTPTRPEVTHLRPAAAHDLVRNQTFGLRFADAVWSPADHPRQVAAMPLSIAMHGSAEGAWQASLALLGSAHCTRPRPSSADIHCCGNGACAVDVEKGSLQRGRCFMFPLRNQCPLSLQCCHTCLHTAARGVRVLHRAACAPPVPVERGAGIACMSLVALSVACMRSRGRH